MIRRAAKVELYLPIASAFSHDALLGCWRSVAMQISTTIEYFPENICTWR